MTRRVSRPGIVAAIVRKDVREFSRDHLYIFLSIFGLLLFVTVYYLVPDTVEESVSIGVHQTDLTDLLATAAAGETAEGDAQGLRLVPYPTEDALRAAVDDGDVPIGLAFPAGFVDAAAAGQQPTVTVYADVAAPPELRDAMTSMVREITFTLTGHPLPVTEPSDVVLGTDRAGDQVSLRDSLLPMLVFFVLMIETFALSSLIASEVANRTVTAVLVTPARVSDFLTAKTIYGALLTGGQALILLIALQALTWSNAGVLLVTAGLGALLFTGIGMVTGAGGKDFFSTLFQTMLVVVPLMVPAFSVLFPGTAAPWVQVLPTYPIIDTLAAVTIDGAGWSDVAGSLGLAAIWVTAIYGVGMAVLRRKVRSL